MMHSNIFTVKAMLTPDHEYAGLIGRVTYYHEEVMVKTDEILASLNEKEIHTAILVKYNKPLMPLTEKSNLMSDDLVTVEKASFGATSSRYGETLPADYTQQLHTDHNLISPDRCIDASTGAYPFNTWYIRDLDHGTRTQGYNELMNAVAYNNLDIYTDARYPQFLVLGEDGQSVIPFENYEPEKEMSFIEKCIALIKRLFEVFVEKIKDFAVKK